MIHCCVQSLSCVPVFVTPWTTARQASLSFTISWSLLKLMSIESVMPSNHLILCCPLLPLPSILPTIRVFSNGSMLHIRWPECWSFSWAHWPVFLKWWSETVCQKSRFRGLLGTSQSTYLRAEPTVSILNRYLPCLSTYGSIETCKNYFSYQNWKWFKI